MERWVIVQVGMHERVVASCLVREVSSRADISYRLAHLVTSFVGLIMKEWHLVLLAGEFEKPWETYEEDEFGIRGRKSGGFPSSLIWNFPSDRLLLFCSRCVTWRTF